MQMAAFSSDMETRSSPLDDDAVAIRFIPTKIYEHEVGLFASKWFDYRHLTPVQATRLYIDVYGDIYRQVFAQFFDSRVAEFIKPLSLDRVLAGLGQADPKAKGQFKACWRGRQVADGIGMPYATYLQLAFRHRLRAWQRPYMPQPQHLYHEFDVEKTVERWQEMIKSELFVAEHPAYLVQNYQGHQHQNDHHEWLFTLAQLRPEPGYVLADFVARDLLPLEKVASRVDEYVLDQVESNLS